VGWFNRDKGKSITDEVAYKLYLEEPSSTNDKKSFSGGGNFASKDYDIIVKLPNGLTTKKDFDGFSKKEVIEWGEIRGWKYNVKGEKEGGNILDNYEFFVKRPTKYNVILPKSKSKMSGGGSTKRGGAMQLAKQIRKDGESWKSALKRANEEIRNK
jgi:hypothetical protein